MKKQVPLQVLRVLESYLKIKNDNVELVKNYGPFLKFIDVDPDSDFFFEVQGYDYPKGGDLHLAVQFKPKNETSVESYADKFTVTSTERIFASWLKMLGQYKDVKSIFDDPIVDAYANEYYHDFEILEDDADETPFDLKRISLLEKHLTKIENEIGEFETPENKSEIDDI